MDLVHSTLFGHEAFLLIKGSIRHSGMPLCGK